MGAAMGSSALPAAGAATAARDPKEPFGYCLNTSTIREQKLPLVDEIDLAAEAGYTAIEPWLREIEQYITNGGQLADLRKRLSDQGITVESAIGFAEWIVDDDARRAKGLEQAKRDFGLIAEIGGKRLAAPPAGATKETGMSLQKIADRYHALCELGMSFGVKPQVEVWGHSSTLGRLGESMYVVLESRHPAACLLPDVYHLHKGGSDFLGLQHLSSDTIQVFHVNDYPDAPRAELTDAHRVYPGDGVAPLDYIFRTLRDIGFTGYLSLELFNKEYWAQDAATVVKTGLEKTRAAVRKALST
ncbi:MAG: sugar phosphate isomerase/epimerase [Planctomycetes bacterium]|nr:sugar phosphate isomerase/epimerase [Planctomycetota bacterium]